MSNQALNQFVIEYLEMREMQKKYFRIRDKLFLEEAKKAERALDTKAKSILGTIEEQQNLF